MAAIEATGGPLKLLVHVINPALSMPICPAARARAWMEATDQRFANRCLPLLMANQAGWFLMSSHSLRVVWNGNNDLGAVTIEWLAGSAPYPALSHFGHGIVTWNVPYLFRTPAGYNLLVRGPANWLKDGAVPLEGIVETDWSAATFTANWKLTRPHHPVTFQAGEPLAMLVPQRRGELESFQPELRRLDEDAELAGRYHRWSTSRTAFNAALSISEADAVKQRWQKHYFQGVEQAGTATPQHQTKLALREVADRRAGPVAAGAPRQARPDAESILGRLFVQEDFADEATCKALVDVHKRFGRLGAESDNGYPLAQALRQHPAGFAAARTVVRRLVALIGERFGERVRCDLALLCALIAGGFRHTLHADNAVVECPRHGRNAEELRRLGCHCPDAVVRPNHTPWRKYSALLYLSGDHSGGDIVFGDGPNAFGGVYRREIRVRPGLLVLSPSNELYFHHTTAVESGVRYSMNSWFTDDAAHAAPEWA